jgi:lipopolysaccharide/colanic/teichoic acid biosynthesis glycosyltransferase
MPGKKGSGSVLSDNDYRHLPCFQEYIKTLFDYLLAFFSLIILSPFILILVILIRISGKGPLIYSQDRIGKAGKPFMIHKFRSMVHDAEYHEPMLSHSNEERVTAVGRFMRKYRLDEIPNFINVLKGEMSIVGPRPERQYFIEKMVIRAPGCLLLQKVKPGITSYGQIRFGYATTVEEMIERLDFDLYYMKHRSLLFDFKILILTIKVVLSGKGV